MLRLSKCLFLFLPFGLADVVVADDSGELPRPIPLTRPEMKEFLEDLKVRKPRIPLPESTAEEKAQLGERGPGYEGRLPSLFMPASDGRGSFGGSLFVRSPFLTFFFLGVFS
jgi:hypothetical protein